MGRNITVLYLCLSLFFCLGCGLSRIIEAEETTEVDEEAKLDYEGTRSARTCRSFFEDYPENWEHHIYQKCASQHDSLIKCNQ